VVDRENSQVFLVGNDSAMHGISFDFIKDSIASKSKMETGKYEVNKTWTVQETQCLVKFVENSIFSPDVDDQHLWDLAYQKRIVNRSAAEMKQHYQQVQKQKEKQKSSERKARSSQRSHSAHDDSEPIFITQASQSEPQGNEIDSPELSEMEVVSPDKVSQKRKQEQDLNQRPAKQAFYSTYISPKHRQAKVKRIVEQLKKDTKNKYSLKILIHALIVYSGNVNLAREYLTSGAQNCRSNPWSVVEDEFIRAGKIDQLSSRLQPEIEERVAFLTKEKHYAM